MKKSSNQKPSLVMVFGVFDLIHDGHKHFLSCAKKLGKEIVVVLATDTMVQVLKKSLPINTLEQRIKNLLSLKIADVIVAGDDKMGSWKVILEKKPNTIALGYDQKALCKELEKFILQKNLIIQCFSIPPHTNIKLHSSLLRAKL